MEKRRYSDFAMPIFDRTVRFCIGTPLIATYNSLRQYVLSDMTSAAPTNKPIRGTVGMLNRG